MGMAFIWRNLNPLHPSMLCAKFGSNWLNGSWEGDYKISSMYSWISLLSPLEKGMIPHLNKIEFPSHKDGLS